MATDKEIGARIRQAREDARLTQEQLADMWLGKTHAAISDIERGKTRVNASRLGQLAQLLNRPVSYFYGETVQVSYLRDGRAADGSVSDSKVVADFKQRLRERLAEQEAGD